MSVIAFPHVEGGVMAALSRLAAKIDDGATGVLVVTIGADRHPSVALHGEMERTDLAYVGALLAKWAVENEQ